MAIHMLYQIDVGGSEPRQVFHAFDLGPYLSGEVAGERHKTAPAAYRRQLERAFEYARSLVQGTIDNGERIDALIASQADNWRLERMPVVDRNVLRLAIYELMVEEDIPKLVVVDEAIELAKRFGSENSSRFVNGLLDGLLKQHRFPGRLS